MEIAIIYKSLAEVKNAYIITFSDKSNDSPCTPLKVLKYNFYFFALNLKYTTMMRCIYISCNVYTFSKLHYTT